VWQHYNEEFLSSSTVHLYLGGHNRYPGAVKTAFEDVDYANNKIQNLIQVDLDFSPQGAIFITWTKLARIQQI
jgi:hypothetical protein